MKRALIWTLLASLLMLWALGLVVPPPEAINAAPRPYLDYGFFVRYI